MVGFMNRGNLSSGGPKLSEIVFVVLIVTGLALTTYFGIAAWRASEDRQSDRIYLLE